MLNIHKAIYIFLIISYSTCLFSQVEVSSRLQEAILKANPDDYIRVLVLLRDQVDVVEMDEGFYRESVSIQQRAYQLINALQEKARTTQINILSYLQEKSQQGNVFQYESYWISNLVMVEAKPHIINQLMTRSDLRQMDLDAYLELDEPIKVSDGEVDGIESTEPGLRIINAHLLWAMGITGQGRLVMGIDTGVHPNHPALNHKWRGNSVPSNQAWFDPAYGTTTPNDCNGHGSHTMGTMVGRSLTTADTVGVAIDAEWIASNSLCGGNPHTSRSIASFQWAMDPDGNPATINDMPDAICNSWFDPSASDCAGSIYKPVFDAVEAAGIAVVFSAGNGGPGASSITIPKNINTNEVNVFSTGAIDGALYLGGSTNPIASFSSRGPSTCGGTGSLLIKPEVSAPGVNVRSSGTATGYSSLSGTSMAAPHVAGAVALLKQAFPNKTGRQILEALYNTSRDLGITGEDNTYGTGLIDVYAAYLNMPELCIAPTNWNAPGDFDSKEVDVQNCGTGGEFNVAITNNFDWIGAAGSTMTGTITEVSVGKNLTGQTRSGSVSFSASPPNGSTTRVFTIQQVLATFLNLPVDHIYIPGDKHCIVTGNASVYNYVVSDRGNISSLWISAGNAVTLYPGFTASPSGSNQFKAEIQQVISDGNDTLEIAGKHLSKPNINESYATATSNKQEGELNKSQSSETKVEIPDSYGLSQNYPNPFNPTTTIRYQLPVDSKVTIKLYDILGREVATLIDGFQNAGYKEIMFDASSLSSGIYIYNLIAGDYVSTMKMIVMK